MTIFLVARLAPHFYPHLSANATDAARAYATVGVGVHVNSAWLHTLRLAAGAIPGANVKGHVRALP